MKMVAQAVIICLLFLTIGEGLRNSSYSPHYKNPHYSYLSTRLFNLGDSSQWSSPDYDHSSWTFKQINFDTTAIFWMRGDLTIDEANNGPYGIKVSALASYEVYFDGIRIGANGKVGKNKDHEIEGQMMHVLPLPDSLVSKGTHLIAIRASNFNASKIRFHSIEVGNLSSLFLNPFKFTLFIFLFAGAFLITTLFYLFIYQKIQRFNAILLGLLCAGFFLLILMEYLKFYHFYDYSFQRVRLVGIEIITSLVAILMPLFLIRRFQQKRQLLLITVIALCIFFVEVRVVQPTSHDLRLMYLYAISAYFSFAILIQSLRQKKEGAGLSLLGLVPFLSIFYYYDSLLFISFFNFLLFNLVSLSRDHSRAIEEKNIALIQSARLELDLLKKNIQPHFLMNTLTSVMEWIEKDPQKGVKLIDQLAKEFKLLLEISDQRLITIRKELELCELHLEIMSYKKLVKHTFNYDSVNLYSEIPPGVFHSIIENGISHSSGNSKLNFVLTENRNLRDVTYELFVSSEKTTPSGMGQGTGTKYIQIRLQEAYGSNWEFSQHPVDSGWLSKIKIHQQQ